jgi:hypothetical protein
LLFRFLVIAYDKRGAFAQGSEATKQSIGDRIHPLDCFVASAPRNDGLILFRAAHETTT